MKIKLNCILIVSLLGMSIVGCSKEPVTEIAQTPTSMSSMLIDTPTSIIQPKSTDTQTPIPAIQSFEGRIAIAGFSSQHSDVWLFDLRNREIQDIQGFGYETISWSPDYQRIAFKASTISSSHTTSINVSNPDGSEPQKYLDNTYSKTDLRWSPDGKFLVFITGASIESSNLAILNLANGEVYLLTDRGYLSNPAWSPDGEHIAYMYQFQLWIMNADGSNSKQLTDLRLTATGIDWSPDGEWLAFVSGEKYNDCGNIYIVKPDGSNLTRLTNLPGCATGVTWSPDGKHLALVIREIPDEMRCQIYIMGAAGENLVAVGEEEEFRIDDIDWGL